MFELLIQRQGIVMTNLSVENLGVNNYPFDIGEVLVMFQRLTIMLSHSRDWQSLHYAPVVKGQPSRTS